MILKLNSAVETSSKVGGADIEKPRKRFDSNFFYICYITKLGVPPPPGKLKIYHVNRPILPTFEEIFPKIFKS